MASIEYTKGDTPKSIADRFAARDDRTVNPITFRVKRRGHRIDAAFQLSGGFLWFHLWRDPGRSWRIVTAGRIPREVESCYSLDEQFGRFVS